MIIAQQGESIRSRIKKVLGLGQTLKCGSIRKTLKEEGLPHREKRQKTRRFEYQRHTWKQCRNWFD